VASCVQKEHLSLKFSALSTAVPIQIYKKNATRDLKSAGALISVKSTIVQSCKVASCVQKRTPVAKIFCTINSCVQMQIYSEALIRETCAKFRKFQTKESIRNLNLAIHCWQDFFKVLVSRDDFKGKVSRDF
jgi:hypothetical protein